MKKISTENLQRFGNCVGLIGGGLAIALNVFQLVMVVKAVKAEKAAAKEEAKHKSKAN
jgi:hypothetical protein